MPPRIYPHVKPRLYLAEWRERQNLTQQQLADRLGTTDVSVSRWETGKRRPDNDTLAAICEAMGIPITAIYRHPDRPSADELLADQTAEVWEQALTIIRTIRR